jgi:uncharacterized membrane protein
VSDLLFWVLCGILFVAAVVCIVFALLAAGHATRYRFWAGAGAWGVLCVALALVLMARFT